MKILLLVLATLIGRCAGRFEIADLRDAAVFSFREQIVETNRYRKP